MGTKCTIIKNCRSKETLRMVEHFISNKLLTNNLITSMIYQILFLKEQLMTVSPCVTYKNGSADQDSIVISGTVPNYLDSTFCYKLHQRTPDDEPPAVFVTRHRMQR